MLAAAQGMETWARTVRVPVYTTTPPADAWQEVCRAELDIPRVWYLTITCAEIEDYVRVFARIRVGNGQTVWREERVVYAWQSYSRLLELWLPARSVQLDVAAASETVQRDVLITGSFAPLVVPPSGVES
jgi:hypothetical protein